MKSQLPARNGLALFEILMTLTVIAIGAEVCMQLFRVSLRTTASAVAEQESSMRQTAAIKLLRADVLHAERWTANANTVELDDHIAWNCDADGLHRTDGAVHRDWLGTQLRFIATTDGIDVRPAIEPTATPARLICIQKLLREVSP